MSQIDRHLKEIDRQLVFLKDSLESDIRNARAESFKNGFDQGVRKAEEVLNFTVDNSNIDWDSIRKFANWCYIHGIDFSYMGKSTDTVPFCDRVIYKFEKSLS